MEDKEGSMADILRGRSAGWQREKRVSRSADEEIGQLTGVNYSIGVTITGRQTGKRAKNKGG